MTVSKTTIQSQFFREMKLKLLFTALLLCMGIVGCEEDEKGKENATTYCDCQNNKYSEYIKDFEGKMLYREDIKTWNIVYKKPNTIDGAIIFLPCDISQNYKHNGIRVIFSGKTFSTSKNISVEIGGVEYKCLKIKEIKKFK